MSTPRGSSPDQTPKGSGSDPAVEALLEYLATTAVTPPSDLTARIQARIAREPDRTPPRRYLLALLHLRLGTAAGAFRQLVGVVGGRGSFPALMRAQALGLVLVTLLAAAGLAAGAAVGVTKLVQDQRSTHPTPPTRTLLPDPTGIPTPRRSEDLVTPTPSDGVHQLDATHRPTEPKQTPRPSRTPRPQQVGGSDPTHTPADATQRPDKTPRAGRPEPTRTPHPTPKKTPRPDRTPRPTEHPEPTETPESDDGSDGGHGPGESDTPDGHDGKGSMWSGDVWLAALVPPSLSDPAEGHA